MSRTLKIILITAAIAFLVIVAGTALFLVAVRSEQTSVQSSPIRLSAEDSFTGKLIDSGAECQLFQTNDGKQYTLTGNLSGFKDGDTVNIKGTMQEMSNCQQGEGTIAVSTITANRAPNLTYASALGYAVNYPASWIVAKEGDIQPDQPDIDNGMPAVYFSTRIEDQSFEQVRKNLQKNGGGRNVVESQVMIDGEKGYAYAEKSPVSNDKGQITGAGYEILVQHNGKVYHAWTQKYNLEEVKQIFSSFRFAETASSTPSGKTDKQASVPPANQTSNGSSFTGKLIAGGAECQLFQTTAGKQYTLTGNLAGFKEGDAVNIKGTLQEMSFCQQGEGTISVSTITHAD